jgi:DNA polymerase III alpha subunit
VSVADFHRRVNPLPKEMEILIRAGGFNEFGQPRTKQIWTPQYLHRTLDDSADGQAWLLPQPTLGLFPDVLGNTYCPVSRLKEHVGQTMTTCGLVMEQRTHHQITGEPMKFLTLADWTGMVETELFAQMYNSYGLATVRYPVLEVEARVEAFDNERGFSLRVLKAGKPRRGRLN